LAWDDISPETFKICFDRKVCGYAIALIYECDRATDWSGVRFWYNSSLKFFVRSRYGAMRYRSMDRCTSLFKDSIADFCCCIRY